MSPLLYLTMLTLAVLPSKLAMVNEVASGHEKGFHSQECQW